MPDIRSHLSGIAPFAMMLVVALSAGVPAWAQTAAPPSAQELNPAQRAPAPATAPQSRGDILSAPEPGPCPLRDSKLTLTLSGVTFTGADTLTPDDLAPAYAGLIGKTVPVSALCDIRDSASRILFRKGIFARVEIPQQKISKGQVTFEVIEAYVARVRVLGNDSSAQAKVEDYIEMLRGMKPFNIEEAQRYLFLASDVPGVTISATLKPAGKERGAIELDVTVVSYRPYDALLNIENFGSTGVGQFGGLLRVDLNSFTPWGDRTTLVDYQTFDIKKQNVAQLLEEVRLGDDGLIAHFSISDGQTHPLGALTPLSLFSLSYVGDLNIAYPLIRRRYENLTVTGGFNYVAEKVDAASSVLSQDNLRIFYATVSGYETFRWDIPVWVQSEFSLRKGIEALGASPANDPLLSRAGGNPAGFVMRSDGAARIGPYYDFTGNLNYQAQYSDSPLLTYEQQAVGNFTIGRGYDPASLNGDRAIAGSAELHYSPMPADWVVTASPYGFYDIARVWNRTPASQNREVRSIGGGMVFQVTQRLRVDTFYAHPLDRISDVAPQKPGDRMFLNLTVSY
jgi:hemolysin activation/secretion protein